MLCSSNPFPLCECATGCHNSMICSTFCSVCPGHLEPVSRDRLHHTAAHHRLPALGAAAPAATRHSGGIMQEEDHPQTPNLETVPRSEEPLSLPLPLHLPTNTCCTTPALCGQRQQYQKNARSSIAGHPHYSQSRGDSCAAGAGCTVHKKRRFPRACSGSALECVLLLLLPSTDKETRNVENAACHKKCLITKFSQVRSSALVFRGQSMHVSFAMYSAMVGLWSPGMCAYHPNRGCWECCGCKHEFDGERQLVTPISVPRR